MTRIANAALTSTASNALAATIRATSDRFGRFVAKPRGRRVPELGRPVDSSWVSAVRPKEAPDRRDQLVDVERLGKEAVRACRSSFAGLDLAERRHHEHTHSL